MRAQHISWGQVFTLHSETLWFLSAASAPLPVSRSSDISYLNSIPKRPRQKKVELLITNTNNYYSFHYQTSISTMILMMCISEILCTAFNITFWNMRCRSPTRRVDSCKEFQESVSQSIVQFLEGTSIQLLTRIFQINSIKNICRPIAMKRSQNWKLGTQDDGDIEAEEVILWVQVIICNWELPPIQKPFQV